MNQKYINLVSIILIALTSSACTDVEEVRSENVATSEIWARFAVYSTNDDKAVVEAWLLVGNSRTGPYVKLSDSDTLEVSVNSANVETLVQSQTISKIIYQTTLDDSQPGEGGKSYRFNFSRADKISAPVSTVTLPATISSLQFNPEKTFSRSAENITVTWDSVAEATIEIEISGDCVNNFSSGIIPDIGTFTLPANGLTSLDNVANDSCSLAFIFRRTNQGIIDPAFGQGGEITAYLSRGVLIESTP